MSKLFAIILIFMMILNSCSCYQIKMKSLTPYQKSLTLKIFQQDEYDLITRKKRLRAWKNNKNKFQTGWTTTAENINGRLAMIGLTIGFINEFITGRSILEQIGIVDRNEQQILVLCMVCLPVFLFARKIVKKFS